jgi:DNA-directed RNA polymerase subunit RPC12/RpoP
VAQIKDGVAYLHCWGCGGDVSVVLNERDTDMVCRECSTRSRVKFTRYGEKWLYTIHGIIDDSERKSE